MKTVHDRFETSSRFGFEPPAHGTFAEAKKHAENLSPDHYPVDIYDVMARKGAPCTWNYINNTWRVVEHKR